MYSIHSQDDCFLGDFVLVETEEEEDDDDDESDDSDDGGGDVFCGV